MGRGTREGGHGWRGRGSVGRKKSVGERLERNSWMKEKKRKKKEEEKNYIYYFKFTTALNNVVFIVLS